MVLSKRERIIALSVGAAIGLFALDAIALTPYLNARKSTEDEYVKAQAQLAESNQMITRQLQLRRVWRDLSEGGMKVNSEDAASQVFAAVQGWAQESGLNVSSLKKERDTPERKFVATSVQARGTGSMSTLAKFLWRIETATIPVRINVVEVKSKKEGADDLEIQLSISTLSGSPDAINAPSQPPQQPPRRTVASASDGRNR